MQVHYRLFRGTASFLLRFTLPAALLPGPPPSSPPLKALRVVPRGEDAAAGEAGEDIWCSCAGPVAEDGCP